MARKNAPDTDTNTNTDTAPAPVKPERTVTIAIRLTPEEDKALRLAAIKRDYRQPVKFARDLILAGLVD